MPYVRSKYRLDFDSRIDALKAEAKKANTLGDELRDIRHMVFQCAVFQTSAAIETYLRLVIDGWAQAIVEHKLGHRLPEHTRSIVAGRALEAGFRRYGYTQDESDLAAAVRAGTPVWPIINAESDLSGVFSGDVVYLKSTYPSYKNIKRLLTRLGVTTPIVKLSTILSRDIETLIDGFQSIRTALAHSSPPLVTIVDVKERLDDMKALVRAIDRTLYRHFVACGGSVCWR